MIMVVGSIGSRVGLIALGGSSPSASAKFNMKILFIFCFICFCGCYTSTKINDDKFNDYLPWWSSNRMESVTNSIILNGREDYACFR